MSEKNKSLVVTLLLFSFLITPVAWSQATNGRRFSLQDAVRLAMKQNPDLKTARLEVEKSDARVREAWGNALPSLDISGTYTRTLKAPIFFASFNDQAVEIEMGFPHAINMALTGKQVLFNAAVIAGVGAAHVYSEMARDLYGSKQLETVTKVRKAYYTALLAKEVISMMHSSLRNAEDNLKNVLLMRKQGIVSEYDELRASVQVENLRPEVIRSENNYALSLDALRSAIGMELDENFEIADSLALEAIDDSLIARAEELAMGSNPNLSAINRQIDLNGAMTSAERSNYLPTVAAFGQYQYQAARSDINFSANDLIPSTQVGITVSMNIFQGLQTRSRVEQAQLEQEKSVEQKASLERTVRTGVHSVVGNIRQARKRVEAQERTVESAEQGYKIVTARFLANAATQLEVNDAQLALTQAKVNRVQAVYDYLTAAADLDQLIGRLPSCAVESNND